jgi:hypothetical protein
MVRQNEDSTRNMGLRMEIRVRMWCCITDRGLVVKKKAWT